MAKDTWEKYPELAIKYMIKHPEIKKICGPTYAQYKPRTVRTWINTLAPDEVRKQGALSKDNEELQLIICKAIGIAP